MKTAVRNTNLKLYFAFLLIVFSSVLTEKVLLAVEVVALFILVCTSRNLYVNKQLKIFGCVLAYLIFHGLITSLAGTNSLLSLLQQLAGVSVSFLFYYLLLHKCTVKDAFSVYRKVALCICAVCYIQQIGMLLGIRFLYSYGFNFINYTMGGRMFRCTAFFQEPSFLCYFLVPIFSYELLTLKKITDWRHLIVVGVLGSGIVLSFSAIGYIGLLLACLIKVVVSKKIVLLLLLVGAFGVLLAISKDFQIRISDTLGVFSKGPNGSTNLSTVTLYLNSCVSLDNFRNTLGFGSGLGSYNYAYEKYYMDHSAGISEYFLNMKLNAFDANSYFLRTMAEVGLIGIVLIFVFLVLNHPKHKRENKLVFWAICIYFLLILMRQGHYFAQGFFMYVVLFIKNKEEDTVKHDNRKNRVRAGKPDAGLCRATRNQEVS